MNEVAMLVVGALVVVAPIPHLIAYLILHEAARQGSKISALEERLSAARWWFASSTIIALLVVNVLLGRPLNIQPPWSQLITGCALLAGSIPAVLFTYRWRTGFFRDQ